MDTYLGYAARVGDSASDKDSLDKADTSGILLERWSLPLVPLVTDALRSAFHAYMPAGEPLKVCKPVKQYLEPER